MSNYLLTNEKKELDKLTTNLEKTLYKTTPIISEKLTNIIKTTKDYNIEDILNEILNNLINDTHSILDRNLTLGLQLGIKNEYFTITSYGGKKQYQNQIENIKDSTLFSFDSISKNLTSIITMYQVRNNILSLNTKINEFNNNYKLDDTIESILKFTAYIKTDKRIDYLSKKETINLLKQCKESIKNKNNYKNYYQYNDLGFMILRQIIPNFLEELDNLLEQIDNKNLTYKNNTSNITGGKKNEENITQDPKGRDIPFPGHTGLYGNIEGLLNLFNQLINTDNILTSLEKEILYKQPYQDPILYQNNIPSLTKDNTPKYINKIAGIYKIPTGIKKDYNKITSFDISNYTTNNALSSAGTCGSWVTADKTIYGHYTAGILTNPYSFIDNNPYPNDINKIPNTPLEVTKKGTIINYSKQLNQYKEIITIYANILELITEYLKKSNNPLPKLKKKKSF